MKPWWSNKSMIEVISLSWWKKTIRMLQTGARKTFSKLSGMFKFQHLREQTEWRTAIWTCLILSRHRWFSIKLALIANTGHKEKLTRAPNLTLLRPTQRCMTSPRLTNWDNKRGSIHTINSCWNRFKERQWGRSSPITTMIRLENKGGLGASPDPPSRAKAQRRVRLRKLMRRTEGDKEEEAPIVSKEMIKRMTFH